MAAGLARSSSRQRGQKRAADAAAMRAHNASLLLNLVWESEGISRADLARQTGLSRSTVSAIVSEHCGSGLITESHVARSTGGRPPIVLCFNDERFRLVGVEMGSSHVSTVVADVRGQPRVVFHRDHDVQGDPEGTLRIIERDIARCVAAARGIGAQVVGVGVAVPCPIHPERPDHLSPRILPRWEGVRLAEHLRQSTGLAVFVDNDANLGALAERWWGAGRETSDFAYVKIATGVGAGLIIDGQIYRGSGGVAGEIGHTAVRAGGPPCRCGLQGCLESLVGTPALLRQVVEQRTAHPDSPLASPTTPLLADLVRAANGGDPFAVEIIQEAGAAMGVALANLFNVTNPERVILGGSLTRAGEILLQPLRKNIRQRALWDAIADRQVQVSPLGEEAIALGAATQVLAAALAEPTLFPSQEST